MIDYVDINNETCEYDGKQHITIRWYYHIPIDDLYTEERVNWWLRHLSDKDWFNANMKSMFLGEVEKATGVCIDCCSITKPSECMKELKKLYDTDPKTFKMPFGKWEGKTLAWIKHFQHDYLVWASNNIPVGSIRKMCRTVLVEL